MSDEYLNHRSIRHDIEARLNKSNTSSSSAQRKRLINADSRRDINLNININ